MTDDERTAVLQTAYWIWEWDLANVCHYGVVEVPFTIKTPANRKNESGEHIRLKTSGRDWLLAHGFADAVLERGFAGGIADACTHSGRISIEAGSCSTRGKILPIVKGGGVVVRLPYLLRLHSPRETERSRWGLVVHPVERRDELVALGMEPWPLGAAFDQALAEKRAREAEEEAELLRPMHTRAIYREIMGTKDEA